HFSYISVSSFHTIKYRYSFYLIQFKAFHSSREVTYERKTQRYRKNDYFDTNFFYVWIQLTLLHHVRTTMKLLHHVRTTMKLF
ncbi:hypothetical protein VIGAN_09065200, partial [Vigna angularis var. angularis]